MPYLLMGQWVEIIIGILLVLGLIVIGILVMWIPKENDPL